MNVLKLCSVGLEKNHLLRNPNACEILMSERHQAYVSKLSDALMVKDYLREKLFKK